MVKPDFVLPPAVTPAERAWLVGAIVVGAALRLAYPSHMAVEHFDEAVYASNVHFGAESNFQYPYREFFAPPLLPAVIEWLHIAWGLTGRDVPGWLPMVPALLAGIATIPSLWWIARTWFSPHAGVAAAWLIALCEFHAAFSRTALTDVPMTLFVLWALHWFARALGAARFRCAVLAGTFTALAWWTKYNGWLPIAIAATSVTLCLILQRALRADWMRAIGVCALGALTAGVLWLPVLWDCQDVGGYAAIAANHRGYVDGWSAWLTNAVAQFDHHAGTYAGWVTLVGIAAPTLIAFALSEHRFGRWVSSTSDDEPIPTLDGSRAMGVGINVAIMAVNPGSWLLIAIGVGLVCSALALRRALRSAAQTPVPSPPSAGEKGQEATLALHAALALVWVASLVIVTPLYRTFPRLMLPLVVGATLAASIFWRRGWIDFTTSNTRRWWLGPTIAVALTAGVLAVRGSIVWEDRSGYRTAAFALAAKVSNSPENRVVYVLGEPALFYNLRAAGAPAVVVNSTAFLNYPPPDTQLFVAAGPLVGGTPEGQAEWDGARDQFEEVATADAARLSSIVCLDQSQNLAHQLAQGEGRARYALYRWSGPAR